MYKKYKKNPKKLQNYASKIIPGTSQLFGKKPELYLPGGEWPTYYSKAKGVNVWGVNNKKYIDFTMVGIGTSVLGYSDPDVNKTAIQALKRSPMNTLNAPEEVELAELLIKLHPWAESVRYCRTGGESMSIAIRLARAYTNKDTVGVQLGGAIKNVISIASGISVGLGYRENTVSAILTRSLKEINSLGACLNISKETIWGLACIGDLMATSFSKYSRNRDFGINIAPEGREHFWRTKFDMSAKPIKNTGSYTSEGSLAHEFLRWFVFGPSRITQ